MSPPLRLAVLISAFASCLVTALPVQAQLTFNGYVQAVAATGNEESITADGDYSEVFGVPGYNASVSASVITMPSSSLSVSSSVDSAVPNGPAQIYGNPYIDYSLEVTGPAGTVPVTVNSALAASISAPAPGAFGMLESVSDFYVQTASSSFEQYITIQDGFATVSDNGPVTVTPVSPLTGFSASFSGANTVTLDTNTSYEVQLLVINWLNVSGLLGGGSMSASASIDPTFQIGTGVSNPSLYSIELSPGVGNVAAIPEPSTYAMMLAGLAMMGVFARRQSKLRARLAT